MTEYAPAAIEAMFDTIKKAIPSAQMAGIIGDSAHTYGYHRGRNYCSDSGDYSTQTGPDQKGSGEAACALDLSWSKASDQYTVSRRLLDAKNDSRMNAARSFFGSTDGVNVCGYDYYYGENCTSDDSHLWHIHLSILREHADDGDALQKIAAVITGGATPEDEDDMPKGELYLYNKSGQITRLANGGTWYCVGWDADLANTGGSGLSLPKGTRYFSMSAWLYTRNMTKDDNLYWRIQTLKQADNSELAKFPVGELRATSGDTDLQFATVGTVSTSTPTNLRILVSSQRDDVEIYNAWWRCFHW